MVALGLAAMAVGCACLTQGHCDCCGQPDPCYIYGYGSGYGAPAIGGYSSHAPVMPGVPGKDRPEIIKDKPMEVPSKDKPDVPSKDKPDLPSKDLPMDLPKDPPASKDKPGVVKDLPPIDKDL
jgi:hypothetical protein